MFVTDLTVYYVFIFLAILSPFLKIAYLMHHNAGM